MPLHGLSAHWSSMQASPAGHASLLHTGSIHSSFTQTCVAAQMIPPQRLSVHSPSRQTWSSGHAISAHE
jgi:hypothetical protein